MGRRLRGCALLAGTSAFFLIMTCMVFFYTPHPARLLRLQHYTAHTTGLPGCVWVEYHMGGYADIPMSSVHSRESLSRDLRSGISMQPFANGLVASKVCVGRHRDAPRRQTPAGQHQQVIRGQETKILNLVSLNLVMLSAITMTSRYYRGVR